MLFNAQIKVDLKELTERVDLMERQLHRLYKEVAILKNPSNVPQQEVALPQRRAAHRERYLVHRKEGGIDIEASLKAINRTAHEIMSERWPKKSAESRIDISLRASRTGQGGLLSREAWLRANPEQLDMFR